MSPQTYRDREMQKEVSHPIFDLRLAGSHAQWDPFFATVAHTRPTKKKANADIRVFSNAVRSSRIKVKGVNEKVHIQ